jgi:hypothetical protein
MEGETMIAAGSRKRLERTHSAGVKRTARVRAAKAQVNSSGLLLAEKSILRTLRRVRRKGRIERVFG